MPDVSSLVKMTGFDATLTSLNTKHTSNKSKHLLNIHKNGSTRNIAEWESEG